MMSPGISWLPSLSEWLVASPFIICELTAGWSFEFRGQHWLLVYVLSFWFAEEQKSIFSVPLRWWAARHLGKWVTVSSRQLINYLLMQASRHQILSTAAANLRRIADGQWWCHRLEVMSQPLLLIPLSECQMDGGEVLRLELGKLFLWETDPSGDVINLGLQCDPTPLGVPELRFPGPAPN